MGDMEQRVALLVGSMTTREKRMQVKASLGEIEGTRTNLGRLGDKVTRATLRDAKKWVAFHRLLLAGLGHTKKVPFKFPKLKKDAAAC